MLTSTPISLGTATAALTNPLSQQLNCFFDLYGLAVARRSLVHTVHCLLLPVIGYSPIIHNHLARMVLTMNRWPYQGWR